MTNEKLSAAQWRVLKAMGGNGADRHLSPSPGSNYNFDAYGEPHGISKIGGWPTIFILEERHLIKRSGSYPKYRFDLTDAGRRAIDEMSDKVHQLPAAAAPPEWQLSPTFRLDEIEAMHEAADWLAENGYITWAGAISEAAFILDPRNRLKEQKG